MKYDFGFTSPSRLSLSAESSNAIPVRSRSSFRTASRGMCGNRAISVSTSSVRVPLTTGTYRCQTPLRCLTPLVRRLGLLGLLFALVPAPAFGQGTELMPGVTYEKIVQFTPHGAVTLHVLTAPRPGDQNG